VLQPSESPGDSQQEFLRVASGGTSQLVVAGGGLWRLQRRV